MCPRRPDLDESELLQELQGLQAREPLPDIEPPALIDQAVRNMARREQPHQRSPLAGNLPWIAGLATASIALIALGISLVQAPPAPGPVYESLESKKTELRSHSEQTELASPSASSLSRSAQAPAADAATTDQETAVNSENHTATAQQLESPTQTNRLEKESALADAPNDTHQAAEQSESADSDSLQSEETAQAWLDLIEQLREQGLQTETVEQLRAWQEKYPDLPLPDWATALLRDQS